jgi:hypothetical protein
VPVLAILAFVGWKFILPAVTGGSVGGSGDAKKELKKEGIDFEAANPDELITAMQKRAKKWRKDAEFYAVSINGFKNDGTIDFSSDSSTMTIEFFSPKLVGSTSSKDRDEGMRKYVINKYKVDEQVWGVKKRYTDVPGTPVPKCTGKQLGKILKDKGLKSKDTALVSLDPGFAFATDGLSFNINVTTPKLHIYVDINDCKILKEL